MRTKIIHSLYYILFIVAFCLLTAGTNNRVYGQDCGEHSKAWKEIISLYNKGYDIVEKIEKQSYQNIDEKLWNQRKTIFSEAANKLSVYIGNCIKVANSLLYLRNNYRLGTFWEIALNAKKAITAYQICLNHPLINSPEAKFDGQPLKPQVQERLGVAKYNSSKRYSDKPRTIYIRRGGGNAIFEEPDIEFLPKRTEDFDFTLENSGCSLEESFSLEDCLCLPIDI
jgi:hypothetical protein